MRAEWSVCEWGNSDDSEASEQQRRRGRERAAWRRDYQDLLIITNATMRARACGRWQSGISEQQETVVVQVRVIGIRNMYREV